MRPDDEIIAVDLEVAHRRDGEVELQRLPIVTVIQRHERSALGAGEEETATNRILLHGVHVDAGRQSARDLLPCLAEITSAINVGVEVLQLMAVDARVSCPRIEVRRFDRRHTAPHSDCRRRHILPASATVRR